VEAIQARLDAVVAPVQVEGQADPAEVFEVVVVGGLADEVLHGAGQTRVVAALLGQQRQGGGRGDGLEADAENSPVAVVDAAALQGTIEEEVAPLGDARVVALAGAAQGQAGPGGRLGPGEVALGPRPADQGRVDVVDVVVLLTLGGPAAQAEQGGRGAVQLLL